MEELRDDRLGKIVTWMQSWARGYLSRKEFKKLQEQRLALQVCQRNLRKYLKLRTWPWYKLWQKVRPLLNVTRIEDEIAVNILIFRFRQNSTIRRTSEDTKEKLLQSASKRFLQESSLLNSFLFNLYQFYIFWARSSISRFRNFKEHVHNFWLKMYLHIFFLTLPKKFFPNFYDP